MLLNYCNFCLSWIVAQVNLDLYHFFSNGPKHKRTGKTFEVQLWCYFIFATFNNISVIGWRSVLLVEETRVPEENHRPVTKLSVV